MAGAALCAWNVGMSGKLEWNCGEVRTLMGENPVMA